MTAEKIAACFLCLTLSTSILHAELTQEEIYQKAFGSKKKKNKSLLVPIFLKEQYVDDISIKVSNDILISINKTKIVKFLEENVQELYLKQNLSFIYEAKESTIEASKFKNLDDIKIYFDKNNISLIIEISASIKKIKNLSLTNKTKLFEKPNVKESLISGFSKIYFNAKKEDDEGIKSSATLDNTITIKDYTLTVPIKKFEDNSYGRGNIFVRKPFLSEKTILDLGETVSNANISSNINPIIGLTYTNSPTFFGADSNSSKRTGNKTIFLKEDATVSIYINDMFKKRIKLSSGTHNI